MIDDRPEDRQQSTSEEADRVGELTKSAILGAGDGTDKNMTKKTGWFKRINLKMQMIQILFILQ